MEETWSDFIVKEKLLHQLFIYKMLVNIKSHKAYKNIIFELTME